MSDQIRSSVRKQLRALRATMAAIIGQLDALEESVGGGAVCEHAEEDRRSLATFDGPGRWQCRRCGHLEEGPPPASAQQGGA